MTYLEALFTDLSQSADRFADRGLHAAAAAFYLEAAKVAKQDDRPVEEATALHFAWKAREAVNERRRA